jgi:hypothetical protein
MKNLLLTIFLVVCMFYAMVSPTICAEYFNIYTYDKDRHLASNAHVEVWDGKVRIADGNSDVDGRFGAWLDSSVRYRITARLDNQFGEWNNYPTQTSRIKIFMND